MRKVTAVIAMVLGASLAFPVQAVETNMDESIHKAHQVHFLGKRAYQQPLVAKADADQAWVGATLRVDQTNPQQTLKVNALGKRPY